MTGLQEVAEQKAPARQFWFDRDHGGALSRFISSDWCRNVATIIAVAVAVGSIYLTGQNQENAINAQFEIQKKQAEFASEKAANDAWIIYREFEEKFLNSTSRPYDFSKLSGEQKRFAYITVERLLMAADIVSLSLGNDKQWEGAFAIEFNKHKTLLLNDLFLQEEGDRISEFCTYRHAVHEWIERAFQSDPSAHQKIVASHEACKRCLDSQGYSDELGKPNNA